MAVFRRPKRHFSVCLYEGDGSADHGHAATYDREPRRLDQRTDRQFENGAPLSETSRRSAPHSQTTGRDHARGCVARSGRSPQTSGVSPIRPPNYVARSSRLGVPRPIYILTNVDTRWRSPSSVDICAARRAAKASAACETTTHHRCRDSGHHPPLTTHAATAAAQPVSDRRAG